MIYKVSQEYKKYPPFELGVDFKGPPSDQGVFPAFSHMNFLPWIQKLDRNPLGSIQKSKIKISPGRKIQYNVIQRQFLFAMKKSTCGPLLVSCVSESVWSDFFSKTKVKLCVFFFLGIELHSYMMTIWGFSRKQYKIPLKSYEATGILSKQVVFFLWLN